METIFVGDLSYFCTDEDLKTLFEPFGPIKSASVRRSTNNESLHYGFVQLRIEDAIVAFHSMQGRKVMGRHLRLNMGKMLKMRNLRKHSYQLHVSFICHDTQMQVNEVVLDEVFTQFGKVLDCVIKQYSLSTESNKQCGYGFVFYETVEAVDAAIAKTKDTPIRNIQFDCTMSHDSNSRIRQPTHAPSSLDSVVDGVDNQSSTLSMGTVKKVQMSPMVSAMHTPLTYPQVPPPLSLPLSTSNNTAVGMTPVIGTGMVAYGGVIPVPPPISTSAYVPSPVSNQHPYTQPHSQSQSQQLQHQPQYYQGSNTYYPLHNHDSTSQNVLYNNMSNAAANNHQPMMVITHPQPQPQSQPPHMIASSYSNSSLVSNSNTTSFSSASTSNLNGMMTNMTIIPTLDSSYNGNHHHVYYSPQTQYTGAANNQTMNMYQPQQQPSSMLYYYPASITSSSANNSTNNSTRTNTPTHAAAATAAATAYITMNTTSLTNTATPSPTAYSPKHHNQHQHHPYFQNTGAPALSVPANYHSYTAPPPGASLNSSSGNTPMTSDANLLGVQQSPYVYSPASAPALLPILPANNSNPTNVSQQQAPQNLGYSSANSHNIYYDHHSSSTSSIVGLQGEAVVYSATPSSYAHTNNSSAVAHNSNHNNANMTVHGSQGRPPQQHRRTNNMYYHPK